MVQKGCLGNPLPAHQLVLRLCSERFAAQIRRWDNTKETRLASQRLVLRVPLGSESEVPAARAAIRFAYTGDVAAGSVREALEVRRQAAYLGVEGCGAACVEHIRSLLAAPAAGAGTAAAAAGEAQATPSALQPVLDLFSSSTLWPEPAEEAGFASVLALAKQRLVAHFGDALAVQNSRPLFKEMFALPAVALEALLESDEFGTDTESSVLLMLAMWMMKNCGSTDAETRARLCRHVRLVQLSRAYLMAVLPALAADYEAYLAAPQQPAPQHPPEACAASAAALKTMDVVISVAASGGAVAPVASGAGNTASGGTEGIADAAAKAAPTVASEEAKAASGDAMASAASAAATSEAAKAASAIAEGNADAATAEAAAGAASEAAGPASSVPKAWFPIKYTEATFIMGFAFATAPEREVLKGIAENTYDLAAPWYLTRPRRQCLPAQGMTHHWHISEKTLLKEINEFEQSDQDVWWVDGRSTNQQAYDELCADGFYWMPALKLSRERLHAPELVFCCLTHTVFPDMIAAPSIHAQVTVTYVEEGYARRETLRLTRQHVSPNQVLGWDLQNLRPQVAGKPLEAWAAYLLSGNMAGTLTILPPGTA